MSQPDTVRPWADRAAIALSSLCAIHCLALPAAIVLMPALASTAVADEAFHAWMVFGVIPVSALALFMGCRRHRRYPVLMTGLAGMLVLIGAVVLGHDILGELGERVVTLAGSILIVFAHWRNYRLCQQQTACEDVCA